jgi:hypothetical protein
MLTAWVNWYMSAGKALGKLFSSCIMQMSQLFIIDKPRPPHIPDITTEEGLLDVIAVGTVIELGFALDHRNYEGGTVAEDEAEEMEAAMSRYRIFIRWYSGRYMLLVDRQWVNPTYIFKKRLAEFAATVRSYVGEQEKDALRLDPHHKLSAQTVYRLILRHLTMHWPTLVDYFMMIKEIPSPFLYHTQPSFKILVKTDMKVEEFKAVGLTEQLQYAGDPIENTLTTRLPPFPIFPLLPISSMSRNLFRGNTGKRATPKSYPDQPPSKRPR